MTEKKNRLVFVGNRDVTTHENNPEENQPKEWRALIKDLRENGNMVVWTTSLVLTENDKKISGLNEDDFDDVFEGMPKSYRQGYEIASKKYGMDITHMFLIDSVFKSVKMIQDCGGNGIEFTTIEEARAALQKNGNLRAPE